MKYNVLLALSVASVISCNANAGSSDSSNHGAVPDDVIAQHRNNLANNTNGEGFGPQSPRDIDSVSGTNSIAFNRAPASSQMNLCNIHFHKNAEHKGGEFTKHAGNGTGHGHKSGYQYSGEFSEAELTPIDYEACPSDHGGLHPGDTIEVHYVHSSAQIQPGPTLGSCLSESINNPQLRVETQVYALVNDSDAADFGTLTEHGQSNGLHQALNIPDGSGTPVQYAGSTTGPSYNEKGSPYQVTWSVRPKVVKVNIDTVSNWCKGNAFDEDHAHGVRNLVMNQDLLSKIAQ